MSIKEAILKGVQEQYLESTKKRPKSVRIQLYDAGEVSVYGNPDDTSIDKSIYGDQITDFPYADIKNIGNSLANIEAALEELFPGVDTRSEDNNFSIRVMSSEDFEASVKRAIEARS